MQFLKILTVIHYLRQTYEYEVAEKYWLGIATWCKLLCKQLWHHKYGKYPELYNSVPLDRWKGKIPMLHHSYGDDLDPDTSEPLDLDKGWYIQPLVGKLRYPPTG